MGRRSESPDERRDKDRERSRHKERRSHRDKKVRLSYKRNANLPCSPDCLLLTIISHLYAGRNTTLSKTNSVDILFAEQAR